MCETVRMLNTIQMNAPHLLRYLTAAVVLNRRRKNLLKDLIKVLLTSLKDLAPATASAAATGSATTTDPLLNFLLSLYVDYNFASALHWLTEARTMLGNDFFLGDATGKEIIENCRVMLFEVYCSVHSRVSFQQMIENVDLSAEIQLDKDGEIVLAGGAADATGGKSVQDDDSVLVSMVRACHVSARIDSYHKELFLTGETPSIYTQVMQRTNNATFRTQQLVQGIAKRVQQKRQQQEQE